VRGPGAAREPLGAYKKLMKSFGEELEEHFFQKGFLQGFVFYK
jgi:hypothetical protein